MELFIDFQVKLTSSKAKYFGSSTTGRWASSAGRRPYPHRSGWVVRPEWIHLNRFRAKNGSIRPKKIRCGVCPHPHRSSAPPPSYSSSASCWCGIHLLERLIFWLNFNICFQISDDIQCTLSAAAATTFTFFNFQKRNLARNDCDKFNFCKKIMCLD